MPSETRCFSAPRSPGHLTMSPPPTSPWTFGRQGGPPPPPHLGPWAGKEVGGGGTLARYLGKVPSGGPTCPFERAFTTSPKCAFVLSRARDGFSGSAPSWVRLRSHLRGRFQATKGPDVAWGTCVLSRVREELECYFLSRRGTSGLTPAQDTTLKKMHNGRNRRRKPAQDELNRHVV